MLSKSYMASNLKAVKAIEPSLHSVKIPDAVRGMEELSSTNSPSKYPSDITLG